mgnify:CR=1 FL=1
MVRVRDLEKSLDFYCAKLGLIEARRYDAEQGRFTNVFLSAPGDESAQVELTYNWDPQDYGGGRNFGHLAYQVDDIYALCPVCYTPLPLPTTPYVEDQVVARSVKNKNLHHLQHSVTVVKRGVQRNKSQTH